MKRVMVPPEWVEYLSSQSETGMGYQVVAVKLKDGRHFDQVVAQNGYFTQARGCREMPFSESDELASVRVNHKKWNFHEEMC